MLARAEKSAVSVPAPPLNVSSPVPPMSVSSPASPLRVSLPAPPSSVSRVGAAVERVDAARPRSARRRRRRRTASPRPSCPPSVIVSSRSRPSTLAPVTAGRAGHVAAVLPGCSRSRAVTRRAGVLDRVRRRAASVDGDGVGLAVGGGEGQGGAGERGVGCLRGWRRDEQDGDPRQERT